MTPTQTYSIQFETRLTKHPRKFHPGKGIEVYQVFWLRPGKDSILVAYVTEASTGSDSMRQSVVSVWGVGILGFCNEAVLLWSNEGCYTSNIAAMKRNIKRELFPRVYELYALLGD